MTNPARLLLHDIAVFDSVSGELMPKSTVLVEQDRIEWVGPAAEAPLVEGAVERDGRGLTVLPGLINCHVHLMGDGHEPEMPDTIEEAVTQAVVNARKALMSGVTSVRDCGSKDGLAIKMSAIVESGYIPGPRIQAAGRVITMTGGHGHWIGREADGPWGVAAAVRAELFAGAHFIKIMATGGVLTKGVSPLQTALHIDELQAAVDEAHNAGKRITSHAIGGPGVKNALRAGLDSIEHACFFDDEAIELALERDTIIVPTLLAVNRIKVNGDTLPAWMHEKVMMEAEASEQGFSAMVAAGVKIAGGTDAGTPFNPHEDMADELELMVRFGMLPARAIQASTAVSAENFGLQDQIGTIEVGKLADLMIVEGNPLDNIRALKHVVGVVQSGVLVRDDFPLAG